MRTAWHILLRSFTAFKLTVFSVTLLAATLVPMVSIPIPTHAVTDCSPNSIVSGGGASQWLGGTGVNVCTTGDDSSNYINNIYGTSTLSGLKWECVELVNRLYLTKGWTTTNWSGNGNTLVNNVPAGLVKESNGSISYLNPGDVITLDKSGTNGHAAIINTTGSSIDIINQNTLSLHSSSSIASGSYGSANVSLNTPLPGYTVQAIIHRPNPTNSRPVSISRGSGNMDVFYRDTSGNLVNIGWNSSTGWGSPTNKASSVSSNPTAVARDSTDMDVFYRDTSGNLYDVGWNSTSGWGSPVERVSDGSVVGDPFVVSRSSGTMDVFYHASISGNDELRGVSWGTSGWSSPYTIVLTNMGGSPTAVGRDSTDMDIFYRDSGNDLVDVGWTYSGGFSSPVARISSGATGDFSVVARDSGDMDVFYPTTSGGMGDEYWNWQTGWANQTWSGSSLLASSGASFVGTPKVIMRDSGDMDVFYQDSYGNLVDKGWNSTTGWAAPYNRAGNIADNPGAVSRDSTDMDVFFRDGGGNLNDAGWNSTSGWGESKPGAGSMA